MTTQYIPLDISLVAVNKTVDPKTGVTTIGYGGVDSHFFSNPNIIPAVGKVVLTGKLETSTLVIVPTVQN